MLSRWRSIRTILFSTYTLIIVLVFTILVVWVYAWVSDLIRDNAVDSLDRLGQSIQDQLDSEIRKLNDVSLNVMYSNLVKSRFHQYIADLEGLDARAESDPQSHAAPSRATATSLQSAKDLAEILTAAIGPSRPVEQLYLYDFTGKVYGNGFDNGERSYDPATTPWFEAVMAANGKYIPMPVVDEQMSKLISSSDKQYAVSLLRLFYDNYNVPIGIVEVKQYYNRIFRSVLDFVKNGEYGESVLIYDDANQIIYPLEADRSLFEPYFRELQANPDADDASRGAFRNPRTGERELLSRHRSDVTGWNTVLIVSEKSLLAPLTDFARNTVLVAATILLFAMFLSFVAAKKITFPIQKIHRLIRGIRLDNLGAGASAAQSMNSGINEMDQLHDAFLQMSARLKQSMGDLLLAQSQEMQAKLVALQAQMNPHFLYNTLATISVMAEDNMNAQIVAMSENMSDILRYIAADEPAVSLATELRHTKQYLDINAIRHGSKLRFDFDADESLLPLTIPKLIVQPLVENALKFATRSSPPWDIRIACQQDGNRWRITVTDNGPGFQEDSLRALHEQIEEAERTNVIPVLKLGGMGLLNIYIRMKLTYGDEAEFVFGNRPSGGAQVTLGGYIRKGE